MSHDFQDARDALRQICAAVPGVKDAPEFLPNAINVFPCLIVYPGNGIWQWGAGYTTVKGLHNITVEIHLADTELQWVDKSAMAFADTIPAAIFADPTWGGVIDTFESIAWAYGALGYSDLKTVGFRWVVQNIKMRTP